MKRIYLNDKDLKNTANTITTIRNSSNDYAYNFITRFQQAFTIVFEENKISVKTMSCGEEVEVLAMSYITFEICSDMFLFDIVGRIKNLLDF